MNQQFRGGGVAKADKERAQGTLLTLGLFSIVMLFAGFSSAYIVSAGSTYWVVFDLPPAFMWSTIIIIASSITMFVAQYAIKGNQMPLFKSMTLLSLALGIGFAVSQVMGWGQLTERGIIAVGNNHIEHIKGEYGVDYKVMKGDQMLKYENGEFYLPDDALNSRPITQDVATKDNTASSYWYLLTFMHLLHLAGGVIALIVIAVRGSNDRYSAEDHHGVTLGARYWHFLGGLWIYLYLFLTIIH